MHWQSLTGTRAALHADDRGVAYGDGLFETIAVRAGQPRLLDRHLARLGLGARRLALSLPPEDRLRDFIAGAIDAAPCDLGRAVLKLIVTRGHGPRGYRYRPGATPGVLLGLEESAPPDSDRYDRGVVLRWCRTRLGRNPSLAGIKHLNRLEQVLARAEWDDENIAEGVMLDAAGFVVCGTMSNLFLVDGGRLLTPAITHAGVAGIMRETVLRTAREIGIDVEVREIEPGRLGEADGLFLTSSQFVLWPVRSLAGRATEIGDTTRTIMAALREEGICEWSG